MTAVARYVKFQATPGEGEILAGLLLRAAGLAGSAEGCDLYLINQAASDPDAIWVTEIWTTAEAADAALEQPGVKENIAEIMPMLAGPPERIELVPRGGIGLEG